MSRVMRPPPSAAGRERASASFIALREERDRGLDLATRQRLHIRRLTETLRLFVEAAEADPATALSPADIARARALLNERL